MTTRSSRTLNAYALLTLLTTATGAYAQAGGSQDPDQPRPTPAPSRPSRATPDHPVISMPWWSQPSSIQVMPMGGASPARATPAGKGGTSNIRTIISMPDGPALPRQAGAGPDARAIGSSGSPAGPGSITLSDGRLLQRDGTITRDGEVVSRAVSITLPEGRVVPVSDLLAREGAVINRDGTIALADGRVIRVDSGPARDASPTPRRIGAPRAPDTVPAAADTDGDNDGATVVAPAPRQTAVPRLKTGLRPSVAPAPVAATPVRALPIRN